MKSFREFLNEGSDYWQSAQIKLLERIQREFASICKGVSEDEWKKLNELDEDLVYISDKRGFVADKSKTQKMYVVMNEYYDDLYLAAKDDNKYWWYLRIDEPVNGEGFGICKDGGKPLQDEDRETYFDEGVTAFVSKWDNFRKELQYRIREIKKLG